MPMRIPRATYRIQLHRGFGFQQLTAILGYLDALGISDIYAAPVFKARPASSHGYDVLNPLQINPELGSPEAWAMLTDKRRALDLGWLQDIVPNHMAYSGQNPHIAALFEKGPHSAQGRFFDILWDHSAPELNGRVCAPFLGHPLEECIEKGEMVLKYDETGLFLAYYDHRFPLSLESYRRVFDPGDERWPEYHRSAEITAWLGLAGELARWKAAGQPGIAELKGELWARCQTSAAIRGLVDRRLRVFNAVGRPEPLRQLCARQCFHLAFWRTAARAINYRRFFSINELIAVRQEERRVFDQTHALVAQLTRSGVFTGLRVDHIDGLLTPERYLDWLRAACGDCYLVVEKIAAAHEQLPRHWPVQGTTGYEFGAHMDRLFTFPGGETPLTAAYAEFCGPQPDYDKVVQESKKQVLEQEFSGDLDNLVSRFQGLVDHRQVSREDLKAALALLLVNMPVYRSYCSSGPLSPADRRILAEARNSAVDRRNALQVPIDHILTLLLSKGEDAAKEQPIGTGDDPRTRAVGAFEQLCAALAAKGVEDTALYRYHRLTALNEVGGDPALFGESPNAFHRFAEQRAHLCPHSLNALSTHDTKRSADVRARLLVLSEMPETWATRVNTWSRMNGGLVQSDASLQRPDAVTEYFLYQTLTATWPLTTDQWVTYAQRIRNYMIKAVREAKRHTSWTDPHPAYEKGLTAFIERVLVADEARPFRDDLGAFAEIVGCYGNINTLARSLIQLTAPGVPDIYQGTEFSDDSLVDPDNRRPVDYEKRRRYLDEIRRAHSRAPGRFSAELLAGADQDKIKLFLIYCGLLIRRRQPELFATGDYLPLAVEGPRASHAIAYARTLGDNWCVTVVPRFLSRISTPETLADHGGTWQATCVVLPSAAPRRWRSVFTETTFDAGNGRLRLDVVMSAFPVALVKAEV